MPNTENHGSRRRTIMLAVTAGIALLAATAACGGSSTNSSGPGAGASTTYAKELAYAQCMRSHGVPNYPDPGSNGGTEFNDNGGSPAVLRAARTACRHLLPNGGQPSQAQQEQAVQRALRYTQCMRSHGVPNFPDPNSQGQFNGSSNGSNDMNPQSPQYQSAQRACQSLIAAAPGA